MGGRAAINAAGHLDLQQAAYHGKPPLPDRSAGFAEISFQCGQKTSSAAPL